MNLHNSNLEKLNKSEFEEINGGGVGHAIAVAALGVAVGALAMQVAENVGYADGKADCPPPPCTE